MSVFEKFNNVLSGNLPGDIVFGVQGPEGKRGPEGPQGPKGDPGYVNYDLAGMGLGNVIINGDSQRFEMDTTEIANNLSTSFSVLNLNLEYSGLVFNGLKATFFPNCNVASISLFGVLVYVTLFVYEGHVIVRADKYSAIPDISDEDDGKIPVVVDGKWTVSALSDIEEIQKIQQDIQGIISDMNYDEIEITGISNNVGTVEKGTVVSEMTVTWSLNRDPVSQTLGGEEIAVTERSATVSMEGRTSVTLKVVDERGAEDSASTGYNAYNGVYYGVLEDGAEIDSGAVLSLNKKLQSGRGITFTVSPSDTQRIAYAIPATGFGTPTFKDANTGFQADMYLAKTFAFTNAHGYETEYNVWLSTNIVPGSITVAVT